MTTDVYYPAGIARFMSDAEEFRLLAREERMELRLVAGLATGGLQFYSQPQLGGGGHIAAVINLNVIFFPSVETSKMWR